MPGNVLIVTVTAAVSGVAKYGLHLRGERARYEHEERLERQRHAYGLLVLRQRAAAEVKVAALLGGIPPSPHRRRPGSTGSGPDQPLASEHTEPA
jgi:hypothetical protein